MSLVINLYGYLIQSFFIRYASSAVYSPNNFWTENVLQIAIGISFPSIPQMTCQQMIALFGEASVPSALQTAMFYTPTNSYQLVTPYTSSSIPSDPVAIYSSSSQWIAKLTLNVSSLSMVPNAASAIPNMVLAQVQGLQNAISAWILYWYSLQIINPTATQISAQTNLMAAAQTATTAALTAAAAVQATPLGKTVDSVQLSTLAPTQLATLISSTNPATQPGVTLMTGPILAATMLVPTPPVASTPALAPTTTPPASPAAPTTTPPVASTTTPPVASTPTPPAASAVPASVAPTTTTPPAASAVPASVAPTTPAVPAKNSPVKTITPLTNPTMQSGS
jgi:hypothetical protein